MKNVSAYSLFVFVVSLFQAIDATQDYSKMSVEQLDAALIVAVKSMSYHDVAQLIQAGAHVNQKITYTKSNYDDYDSIITCSLVEYVAGRGYLDVVQALVQADIPTQDLDRALVASALGGYEDVVAALVQTKVSVNGMNDALMVTAHNFYGQSYSLGIMQTLIKAGAQVNAKGWHDDTVLMMALRNSPYRNASSRNDIIVARKENRIELIRFLLQTKVDVNMSNYIGDTALMVAIKNHDFDIVQLLLQVPGININHANHDGNTACMIAIQSIQFTYIQGNQEQYDHCVNSQEIFDLLLQFPDVDYLHVNKKGDTAVSMLNKLLGDMDR